MAGIKLNFDAIKKAADAIVTTDEAKAEAKKAFRNYIESGVGGERLVSAGDGKPIPTKGDMRAIANDFVKILASEAGEVPGSIASILQSVMMVGPIEQAANIFVYKIVIPRDLHRESLYPKGYDGIENIVALFDEGYTARDHVYGYNSQGERIASRISREPLNFMRRAATAFNEKYSDAYKAIIEVGWD